MSDLVFVDTCVWALFFNKPASAEKVATDTLIDADRVALVGPVLAEVLRGIRRKDHAAWVASRLRGMHFIETPWNDWQAAATLGRSFAAKGDRIPLTDLLLAAVAQRRDAQVYTTDPHFDLFPTLKRYRPE